MGKHSARADRARTGSAAAPGTGRRRAPEGTGRPAVPHDHEAAPPVPGPGPGRRRGVSSEREAADLAADFDALFTAGLGAAGHPQAGFGQDHGSAAGPGENPAAEPPARPSARAGHPEQQRDAAAGWGVIGAQRAQRGQGQPAARQPAGPTHFTTGFTPSGSPGPRDGGTGTRGRVPEPRRAPGHTPSGNGRGPRGSGRAVARTVTGVAAAMVTTVLAVVIAGQVHKGAGDRTEASAADLRRSDPDAASRSDSRPTPNGGAAVPATYEQKMAKKYPLDATAGASGEFMPVPGGDKAPGSGEVMRYRVDVEKGLPLDGELFATAVHRTLNDDRSWGHGGKRAFERVSSGDADFVVTLASPRATAAWCAKSGLDTTEDNVSCDSAATDRVMINAYRWAQGSQTFGDEMQAYRQMLINHEVGHRLGHDHESCSADGALAPVMMQQTKFLTTDGKTCRPNPWPYPEPGSVSAS
ncbi:hypothetical protein BLA24_25225 [Streptomyces cinnamoneus]|uniref:DUF3152 domain-containing protein n=1 Tax=Streptomyces cinnamoneus TaxID=53446 RepID=A0A2G1XDS5_STRCJ|nr:DUF3152 domain-containing protein [Streptomyces cinnamoneus]PHQ49355.1 hypothetical protein BLA24_25225 [Streptomyces cinnamoneus]PPT14997.1 DUF3152 domain-containing protein [Streptomyces cinnamoneus]